jgi:3-mercaptopropionate dioxygenase
VGVLSGIEHEELFDEALSPIGARDNSPGEVSGFAPPGDIHRIRGVGDEIAISLHIYGVIVALAEQTK